MSTQNTVSTLTGLFKEIYSDKIEHLVPETAILTKEIKFSEAERIGSKYHQPVVLTTEAGVTVAASGSGAVSLNSSVAATMQDAQVQGASLYIRGQLTYDAAAKASTSKVAFVKATELLVTNLIESSTKRLEIMMLYGQTGLGTISSVSSGVITLSAASWAPGIWGGLEGSSLDAYSSGGSKINTNAALVLSFVDFVNKAITVTGNSTDLAALAATQVLYFRGHFGQEFAGLDKIVTNTSTIFNIDASVYSLWAGNTYSVGGAITLAHILAATNKAVSRGLMEDIKCLISPAKFAVLSTNEAALRHYDSSFKTGEFTNGAEAITFFGPNGKISVTPHPMVKEGEAFLIPMKRLKRVGATDVTFTLPGMKDELFLHVPDMNVYELRLMADQAIFCTHPSWCVKMTSIS